MRSTASVRTSSLVIVLLTSCGGDDGMPPPTTGTLDVTITAPVGGTAQVTVSGPNGYSMVLGASTMLTELEPGSYSFDAPSVVVKGAIVSTVDDAAITGAPAMVAAGDTATVDVTYAVRTGTGHLWYVDSSNSVISSFDASVLGATGSPTPAVGLEIPQTSYPGALLFDPAGNAWFASGANNTINRLEPAALGATGTPTPSATISTGSTYPDALKFDAMGNLWVGGLTTPPSFIEYKAADVAGSGALPAVPVVTITIPVAFFFGDLSVDSAGNVWVALRNNSSHTGTIYGYSPAQLAQSGSPSPNKILTSTDLTQPVGLAFDAQGNLWAANFADGPNPNSLVRFDQALLAGTGTTTTSSFTISSTAFNSPNALAFDEAGNLWVTNGNGGGPKILRFAASQLVGTGSTTLTPDVILTTSAGGLSDVAFDPSP